MTPPYGCLCGGCASCLKAQGYTDTEIFGAECAADKCYQTALSGIEYCEEHEHLQYEEEPK